MHSLSTFIYLHNASPTLQQQHAENAPQSPPMATTNLNPTLSSSFFLLLLLSFAAGGIVFPPTCERIECPSYKVVGVGNGFEIRQYPSTEWMSTSPIDDISFVGATRTGFLQWVWFLFCGLSVLYLFVGVAFRRALYVHYKIRKSYLSFFYFSMG